MLGDIYLGYEQKSSCVITTVVCCSVIMWLPKWVLERRAWHPKQSPGVPLSKKRNWDTGWLAQAPDRLLLIKLLHSIPEHVRKSVPLEMLKCFISKCVQFPGSPNLLDLNLTHWLTVMLPKKIIIESHMGEAWCHKSVTACFSQKKQNDDSEVVAGVLISKQGTWRGPTPSIGNGARGQCLEEPGCDSWQCGVTQLHSWTCHTIQSTHLTCVAQLSWSEQGGCGQLRVSISIVSVTNKHKLSDFKLHKLIQKSKMYFIFHYITLKCLQVLAEGSKGQSVSLSFSAPSSHLDPWPVVPPPLDLLLPPVAFLLGWTVMTLDPRGSPQIISPWQNLQLRSCFTIKQRPQFWGLRHAYLGDPYSTFYTGPSCVAHHWGKLSIPFTTPRDT